ncbi:unnamed protein product, partial [Ectocarpus sp. 12 AP-2014]
ALCCLSSCTGAVPVLPVLNNMEDSPTSESRGRRKIMEEDDDSASSEKGVPSAGEASSATGRGGALGGTGLSSDSEDEEAENEASKSAPKKGGGDADAGSGEEGDNKAKSAM